MDQLDQQDVILMREDREDVKTRNLHFHLRVYELNIRYDCYINFVFYNECRETQIKCHLCWPIAMIFVIEYLRW
jgi:hypothetical protein